MPHTTRGLCLAIVLAVLSTADVATAEIYRWTDGAGRLHFSQDLGKVPVDKRAQAQSDAAKPRRDSLQVYRSSGTANRAPAARRGFRGWF